MPAPIILLEHLHRIVVHDAQVVEPLFADAPQQRADARRMNLDAEEVAARLRGGDLRCGVAHAEADLEQRRGLAAEDLGKHQRLRPERQHEARAEFVQRPLLARADAPGAQHIAADARRRARQGHHRVTVAAGPDAPAGRSKLAPWTRKRVAEAAV